MTDDDTDSEQNSTALERTDCAHCDGTGQVMESVAGRSGYVPCDACDNVPEYAVPSDPPDDPHARLEEIEERMAEIEDERERRDQFCKDVADVRQSLQELANHEMMDDEDATVLMHFVETMQRRQIGHYRGRLDGERRQLSEEKALLRQYITALEDQP